MSRLNLHQLAFGAFVVLGVVGSAFGRDIVLDEDLVVDGSTYHNLSDNYSGPGGIRIVGDYSGTNRIVSFTGYVQKNLTDDGVFVIPNAKVSEVTPVSAYSGGKIMIRGLYDFIGHRCDFKDYSTFECQYQENKGNSVKVVGMKLTQVGPDVVVTLSGLCEYFEYNDMTNETGQIIRSKSEIAGSLVGALDFHGQLNRTKLTPDSWSENTKTFWSGVPGTSATDNGYCICDPVFSVAPAFVRTAVIPGYLTQNPTTIFTNAYYLNVEPVSARISSGGMINASLLGKPIQFFHRYDDSGASGGCSYYQAQFAEGYYIKTIYMKIAQQGDDVVVYAAHAPGAMGGNSALASYTDFGAGNQELAASQVGIYDAQLGEQPGCVFHSGTLSTSDTQSGYGMTNILFALRREAVKLTGCNTYTGGTHVERAFVALDGGSDCCGIPTNGVVTVTNDAVFAIDKYSSFVKADINIRKGGCLRLSGKWTTDSNTRLTIDGGLFECLTSETRVEGVVLRNGAELTGKDHNQRWFRLVNGGMQPYGYKLVRSEGEGTNLLSATMMMYGKGSYMSFDTEADLLVTGGLLVSRDDPNTYALSTIYKRCAGDLLLRGRTTNWAEWRLLEGAVRLEASDTLWASNALYLAGGDLVCAAATSNGVKSLSINASAQTLNRWSVPAASGGEIVFEPGSKLTVAAKGDIWPAVDVNRITISGELTNGNFRVGTSKCLPRSSLRAFEYRNEHGELFGVDQDADGYLLPGAVKGLMILFK